MAKKKTKTRAKPKARTKTKVTRRVKSVESDGGFFLKLILYIILGSLWLKFASPIQIGAIIVNGIPIGLIIGLLIARRDQSQVDRKIEYAILVVITILAYFLPSGIVI